MKKLKKFLISFSDLKEGKHTYNLKAKDTFFDCFEYSEVKHGSVSVEIKLHKHSTFLELEIFIQGEIETMCDRCIESFDLKIEGETKVVVKYGAEFLDEGDDIIVLPPSENEVDISGLVYESIMLSIPSRRIHSEEQCNAEALKALNEIRIEEAIEESESEESDPRWDALKKLK